MLQVSSDDVSDKTRRKQRAMHHLFVFFTFLEHVGDTAFAAVVAIGMGSHEDTSTTLLRWAFTTKTTDLACLVNLKARETDERCFLQCLEVTL